MNVRVYGWLSEAQRSEIRAVLQSGLDRWKDTWCADSTADKWIVEFEAPATDPSPMLHWFHAAGSTGGCWLGLPAQAHRDLGARLCHIGVPDSKGLAEHVGREAFAALLSVWGFDGVAEAAIPPSSTANRKGAWLRLSGFPVGAVRAYMDTEAVSGLLGRPLSVSPTNSSMVKRQEAVALVEIPLRTELSLGSIDLKDGLTLRVGDVLKTNAKLDDEIHLLGAAGQKCANGILTMADGAKALRISSMGN